MLFESIPNFQLYEVQKLYPFNYNHLETLSIVKLRLRIFKASAQGDILSFPSIKVGLNKKNISPLPTESLT